MAAAWHRPSSSSRYARLTRSSRASRPNPPPYMPAVRTGRRYFTGRWSPPVPSPCGRPAFAAAIPSRSCASSTVPITWPTTRPSAPMKYVSGRPGDAPGALGVVARVAHVREGQAELGDEVARVLARVLRVEPEEEHAVLLLVRALEHLRLGAARIAPGGPEVDHERRAAQLVERRPCRRRRPCCQAGPASRPSASAASENPGAATAFPRESASSIVESVALVVSP